MKNKLIAFITLLLFAVLMLQVDIAKAEDICDPTIPDIIRPKIFGTNDIWYQIGDPAPDYNNGVTVSDNCGAVTLDIVDEHVNLTVPGDYPLYYYATDATKNTRQVMVHVFVRLDITLPVINNAVDKQVEFNTVLTDQFFLNGVSATDNLDGDLTSSIIVDYSLVNVNLLGDYPATYSVTDANGNTTIANITVSVVDTTAPVITANPRSFTVEAFSVLTDADYINEVHATAIDAHDGPVAITVDSSNVRLNQIGSYAVRLIAVDSEGNRSEKIIAVRVIDTTAPAFIGLSNKTVEVFTSSIDYLAGVVAFDEYDQEIPFTVDSSLVNLNVVGTYEVFYTAVDSSGNSVTQSIFVTVEDTTAPVISGQVNHEVEVFTPSIDYLAGVTAVDLYDGPVTINVDYSLVDLNTLGTYVVTYTAVDAAGNVATETINVVVVDTTAPIIIGATNKTVEVFTPTVDYIGLATADDAYDGILLIVVDDSLVNLDVVGNYDVTLTATDLSGNATSVVITLTVEDTTPPVITGAVDFAIEVLSTNVDYLRAAVAEDLYNGLLPITINSSAVRLDVLGTYPVILSAVDEAGNEATTTIYVTVQDTQGPPIHGTHDYVLPVFSSLVDFLVGVTVGEDFSGTTRVTVNSSAVQYDVVGVYTIVYTARDLIGNTTVVRQTVTIVDEDAPVISGAQDFSIEVDSDPVDYVALSHAVATDEYDGIIPITADFSKVDISTLGTYEVTLNAVDDNGNPAIPVVIHVTVIDETAPVISGAVDLTVEFGTTIVDYLAGVSALDNYDGSVLVTADASDVNLALLGSYEVVYTAIDANNNETSVIVTLTVVDTTAPVISGYQDQTLEVFSPSVDYQTGVIATDLYDGDVAVTFSGSVDLNVVGVYPITITATDAASNVATVTININVVDTTKPVISGAVDLTVEVFTPSVDYMLGVSANDLYDLDLTSSIIVDDSDVDLDVLGTYNVIYSVTDANGNEETVTITVTVVDTTAPVISGHVDFSVEVFSTNVDYKRSATAVDGYYGNLEIVVDASAVNLNLLGTYDVILSATDNSGNSTSVTIHVTVQDTTAPIMSGCADFSVEVFSTNVDYIRAATVVDLYDKDVQIEVDDDDVNLNVLGDYTVILTATDDSGNIVIEVIFVSVIDTTAPVISGHQNYTVEVFTGSIDYLSGVIAEDLYWGILPINVDDSAVDFATVGTYQVILSAIDLSLNEVEAIITVNVVDTTAPVFLDYESMFYYEIGEATPDFLAPLSIEDNYDGVIPNDNEHVFVYDEYVNYNVDGTYPLTYVVYDSQGNKATLSVYVQIYDADSPLLTAPIEFIISTNTLIVDYMQGVTATDNAAGDITDRVVVNDSGVIYGQVGVYLVKYIVTDLSGNATVIQRPVTIVEGDVNPVISGYQDYEVEVFTNSIDYLANVTAEDLYGRDLTVAVDNSQVNLNIVGTYNVTLTAKDQYSNETVITITVDVVDTTAPVINGYLYYTVEVFTPGINFLNGVTAIDLYDGIVLVNVDASQVNFNQVGVYNVTYTATDANGNTATQVITVTVVDTMAPAIYYYADITVEVFTSSVDYLAYAYAYDQYDNNILLSVDASLVDLNVVGDYTITYTATDSSGNTSSLLIHVYVIDITAPVISGTKELTVEVLTSSVNYLDGVSAFDAYDGNVDVIADDSHVNLNEVGQYFVVYSATDANGNLVLAGITVNVVDTTAPVISGQVNHTVEAFAGNVDYLAGVTAVDAYDGSLAITVDASKVKLNVVGTYEVTLTAEDANNNRASQVITVTVVDTTAPVISGHHDITVEVLTSSVDYLAGVTAFDLYDGIVNVTVDANLVKLNVVGSYAITYIATDANGNSSSQVVNVNVVDTIAPVISGQQNITKEVFTSSIDYLAGVSASDLYDGNVLVTVDSSKVKLNVVGTYEVVYIAKDANNNSSSKVITVTIVDTQAPVISGQKNFTVEVNTSNINYLAGVTAVDAYDGNVTISVNDSLVKLNVVGVYEVTLTAKDAHNNSTSKVITVTVVDTTAPVISGHQDLTVEVGSSSVNYLNNVIALDNLDGLLTITVNASEVDLGVVGNYNVTLTAKDANNNETSVVIKLSVVDTTAPIINGLKNRTVELKSSPVSYLQGISASDNYSTQITLEADSSKVNYEVIGIYRVTVKAKDQAGNEAIGSYQINVVDTTAPVIAGYKDVTIKEGEEFDPLAGITVSDNNDNLSVGSIKVESDYDVNTPGSYKVKLSITDMCGNTAEVNYILVVEKVYTTEIIIAAAVAAVLVGVVTFAFIKRK